MFLRENSGIIAVRREPAPRYFSIQVPPDKQLGHAGANVEGGKSDARLKIARLKKNGVPFASRLWKFLIWSGSCSLGADFFNLFLAHCNRSGMVMCNTKRISTIIVDEL